jgi:hypothetical protein
LINSAILLTNATISIFIRWSYVTEHLKLIWLGRGSLLSLEDRIQWCLGSHGVSWADSPIDFSLNSMNMALLISVLCIVPLNTSVTYSAFYISADVLERLSSRIEHLFGVGAGPWTPLRRAGEVSEILRTRLQPSLNIDH